MRFIFVSGLVVVLFLFSGCLDEDEDIFDAILGTGEEIVCDNIDPSKINDEWDRAHCFKDAAIRQGKAELCEKVDKTAPKTKCYMEIAEKKGEVDLCNNLEMYPESYSGAYSRLECWYRVAVKTGDTSICNLIGTHKYNTFTTEISLESCHRAAALAKTSTTTSTTTTTTSTTTTSTTLDPSCGSLGQECCWEAFIDEIDEWCHPGMDCVGGKCVKSSTTSTSSSTTTTVRDPSCGSLGQECCWESYLDYYDEWCYDGLSCGEGFRCVSASTTTSSTTTSSTTITSPTLDPSCGSLGQECCWEPLMDEIDEWCHPGFECVSGRCVSS